MDSDYEKRPGMSFSGFRRVILNLLTILVLITTVCVVVAFLALFINPNFSFNPYPPPTLLPTLGSPTATHTPAKPLPAQWTPTITFTPAPSAVPSPTLTETPIPTEQVPTEEAEMPFALQVGSPSAIQNFVNDLGCDYMGIFGQAFDFENSPIIDLTIHLGGELEGVGSFDLDAITGSAPDLGPGGYLFDVADQPIESAETLWVQLDDGSGNPVSGKEFLITSDSCTENLIMVNWRQIR